MKSVASLLVFASWALIFWPNVESRNGYSYADCTYLEENVNRTYYGRRCFCYNSGRGIKWKDIWSTFQVRVTDNDDENVVAVYPMETRDCHDPNNLLTLAKCTVEHYWPPAVEHGKILDIPLVEEDVCFMVKSPRASTAYTLHVSGKRLNKMRFGLFLGGLLLFCFAGGICRSSVFYYTTGVTFGIVSILLLLLFVMKNFIPKRGVFLAFFGAGTGVSYLGFQKVMAAWEDITKNYWREMLGYLAVTGFISLALCYKRGPITCERTLTLMTWCMQAVALTLLWAGISYPPAAYTLMGALMSMRLLPVVVAILVGIVRFVWHLLCSFLGLFRRRRQPRRLLTEDEYREQGEKHTRASLEQLRESCRTPGFPAWDTVLKLSNPQRFANFLRNGSHVSSAEQESHEHHYGVGGAYYENVFFSGRRSWGLQHSDGDDDDLNSGGGGGDDLSDDEMQPYARTPPTPQTKPNPIPTPLSFPVYTPPPSTPSPFCPYPPAPAPSPTPTPTPSLYPPLPMMEVDEEDEDLF